MVAGLGSGRNSFRKELAWSVAEGSCGKKLFFFVCLFPERGAANSTSADILQTPVYTEHSFPCSVMSTFLLPPLALWGKHIIITGSGSSRSWLPRS